MKKTAFANRPISTVEHIHYLHIYYDLSEEAKEEAFSQYDNEDDARWYTADGIREFVRDASNIWPVDTCNECDEIYECSSPMVLVVREYEEA